MRAFEIFVICTRRGKLAAALLTKKNKEFVLAANKIKLSVDF